MLKQLLRLTRLVVIGLLALASVGCASFMNSPLTAVAIDSNPQNAYYVVTDHEGHTVHSGTTPDVVTLHNSKAMFQRAQYTVSYEAAGLPSQTSELNATLSPYYFGNLVGAFAGVIGFFIIDPFTGAIYDLPESHFVDLNASSNGAGALNDDSDILNVASGEKP